jgi:hypothetical protein
MMLKGRSCNDILMIQAKLRDSLAEFQTMHLKNSSNSDAITGLTV